MSRTKSSVHFVHSVSAFRNPRFAFHIPPSPIGTKDKLVGLWCSAAQILRRKPHEPLLTRIVRILANALKIPTGFNHSAQRLPRMLLGLPWVNHPQNNSLLPSDGRRWPQAG